MFRTLVSCITLALVIFGQDKPAEKPNPRRGLPLKTERKLEFTTNEGTWLSLDVSKDGRAVLFELLGDLYTVPIEGGEAKRITSGLGFDSQPVYSPDSSRIAFVSDREGSENLWIAKADGSEPKQLTRDQQGGYASPAWTPDGDYIIVSRSTPASRTYELWMYHVQGGSGVQITRASSGPAGPPRPGGPPEQRRNDMGAAVSPDGRFIYFARRTNLFGYNVNFPLWQIYRRDRNTGDEDLITDMPGSAIRPVLSPDGKKLVFGTRHETQTGLRIRDLESGEERWLKYPIQRDDQEAIASRDTLPRYAFTPDGKELLTTFDGKIQRIQVATGESRELPFTAQVSLDLGPLLNFPARVDQGSVKSRLIQQPVQSPDGSKLVFSALRRLYVQDLPSGSPRRLTSVDAREFQPAWSPDGQWIAHITWSNDGGHIWKTSAAGSGSPQQLTRLPAFYRNLAWSPDGQRIVALRSARQSRLERENTAASDVVWIPSSGGDATLIVPQRGMGRPHFSAQNDRVWFYSRDGLLSMRYDGSDRRVHLKVVGRSISPEPLPASDVRISPNGRMALALVANHLYVLMVPQPGGEPPTVNVNSASVPAKRLTEIGADYFEWSDAGKSMTWALGSSFFRLKLDQVTFEAPRPQPEGDATESTAERRQDKVPPAEEIVVTIDVPRHKTDGTVVLRGARVITMKGDEVINDADVVVTGNRIVSVGKKGAVPQGAKVIDLKGATIMPGIVDVHAHYSEVRRGVLEEQSWTLAANLAYGVTSGRDPQTGTNDMFAYQDLVDAGEMLGPRAFSTGPGVFSNTNFQSADEAKHTVAKYAKYYRTNTLKSYMVGNRKQRQWMVEASKENRIMPTTEGALDLKLEMTHAIDGFSGNEHSLPVVPLYKDVVELFAKSGITYTPTLLVAYGGPWAENYFYETTEVHDDPKMRRFFPLSTLAQKTRRRPWFRQDEHVFPKLAASAAKIIRSGGRVCIGGHGQLQGIQCHWEMWALASGGLTPHEVLRAATIHGAEAIGFAQDLGSIEPGKLADLVVLNKNPLDDIRNTNTIRLVMKDGELFEGDTLNQVWPKQKPLPEMWWWKEKL